VKIPFFLLLSSLIIPVLFVFSGCDIQQSTGNIHLSSPLALQVFSFSGDNFMNLQFEGFNTENYFSGYIVFISTNTNPAAGSTNWLTLYNPSVVSGNVTNINNTNLVTMTETYVSAETTYYLSVSNYMIPPLASPSFIFTNNGTTVYYFMVEAYTAQFSTNSQPSETAGTNYIGP
jgi:hypothetical protein